ncbi:unnamed protein product [Mesocestoides corti]|uniref:Secreted protein n=1 Tax=Mesocestoides corti TaxID=53468 RepID=A0A0R3UN45_MESCO|nr:unnamed protein product [Mesocestoides corti]
MCFTLPAGAVRVLLLRVYEGPCGLLLAGRSEALRACSRSCLPPHWRCLQLRRRVTEILSRDPCTQGNPSRVEGGSRVNEIEPSASACSEISSPTQFRLLPQADFRAMQLLFLPSCNQVGISNFLL